MGETGGRVGREGGGTPPDFGQKNRSLLLQAPLIHTSCRPDLRSGSTLVRIPQASKSTPRSRRPRPTDVAPVVVQRRVDQVGRCSRASSRCSSTRASRASSSLQLPHLDDMPMVSVMSKVMTSRSSSPTSRRPGATWCSSSTSASRCVLDLIFAFLETHTEGNTTTISGIPNANNVREPHAEVGHGVVIIVHLAPSSWSTARTSSPCSPSRGGGQHRRLRLPQAAGAATGSFHEEFTLLMISSSLSLLGLTLFGIRMNCEGKMLPRHALPPPIRGGWLAAQYEK